MASHVPRSHDPTPLAGSPTGVGRRRESPPRPVPGPILFARYAYGPNQLGYCGPEEAQALFESATGTAADLGLLRDLARQFEGAFPYLQLIARTNAIADPLDPRVVEAYWLGNELLEGVGSGAFTDSLRLRFRPRLGVDGWRWLGGKPGVGAVPVHAFHVLDVFPRVGLLRTGAMDRALEIMDSCRIRWGRVLERDGDFLVVSSVPLELVDGRLVLSKPRPERIRGWRDGAGFVAGAEPGDVVSIHWDWACDRLDSQRLSALMGWTHRELAIANLTI